MGEFLNKEMMKINASTFYFEFKHWLFTIFTVCCTLNLKAQDILVKSWERTFQGDESNIPKLIQPTNDWGFIVGGKIPGTYNPNRKWGDDYFVVKLDTIGNQQWSINVGGKNFDYLQSVKETPDGGFILGGSSTSGKYGEEGLSASGNYDCWILKADNQGKKVWSKNAREDGNCHLTGLLPTADTGYILSGTNGYNDYWVIKVNADGNKIWDRSFYGWEGFAGAGEKLELQLTRDGNYIIYGSKFLPDIRVVNKDFWFIKLGVNGNIIWDRTYGGINSEDLFSLHQINNGEFILAGRSYSAEIRGDTTPIKNYIQDLWILKLNSNGDILWEKTVSNKGNDFIIKTLPTSDGGFVMLCGSVYRRKGKNRRAEEVKYWFLKVDNSGKMVIKKALGKRDFWHRFLFQTPDGGFILVKSAMRRTSSRSFVKLNHKGNQIWELPISPDYIGDFDICQFADGDFIIGGPVRNEGNKSNYKLTKFKLESK